jgi:hypothetical protein
MSPDVTCGVLVVSCAIYHSIGVCDGFGYDLPFRDMEVSIVPDTSVSHFHVPCGFHA